MKIKYEKKIFIKKKRYFDAKVVTESLNLKKKIYFKMNSS